MNVILFHSLKQIVNKFKVNPTKLEKNALKSFRNSQIRKINFFKAISPIIPKMIVNEFLPTKNHGHRFPDVIVGHIQMKMEIL